MPETALGELVNLHNTARRPIKASDRVRGTTPYYGASGIVDHVEGFTHDGHFLLVSEDGENLRSRSTPVAFEAKGLMWVNNHAHVLSGKQAWDTRFIKYAIASIDIMGYLTGSAQPKLTQSALLSIRLPDPGPGKRKAIAEVLGALDDKIAANATTLAVLDEFAQSEFTRTRQAVVSAPVTFGDVAAIGGGATPKTAISDYWEGDVAWATPTDVTGLAAPYLSVTKRSLTAQGLASCSSPLYPAGSILMTSRATIGAFAVTQKPMAVNQGFIVVNAINPDHQWWLFHEMRARVDEFLTFANGATFLELPRGRFKDLPVQVPDEDMARVFRAGVAPLHERAVALVEENVRLAATRDELLPLLMSGYITVRGAEETDALVSGVAAGSLAAPDTNTTLASR